MSPNWRTGTRFALGVLGDRWRNERQLHKRAMPARPLVSDGNACAHSAPRSCVSICGLVKVGRKIVGVAAPSPRLHCHANQAWPAQAPTSPTTARTAASIARLDRVRRWLWRHHAATETPHPAALSERSFAQRGDSGCDDRIKPRLIDRATGAHRRCDHWDWRPRQSAASRYETGQTAWR